MSSLEGTVRTWVEIGNAVGEIMEHEGGLIGTEQITEPSRISGKK